MRQPFRRSDAREQKKRKHFLARCHVRDHLCHAVVQLVSLDRAALKDGQKSRTNVGYTGMLADLKKEDTGDHREVELPT